MKKPIGWWMGLWGLVASGGWAAPGDKPVYKLEPGVTHRFHVMSDHRTIDFSGGLVDRAESWIKVTPGTPRADGAVPVTMAPERLKFVWRGSGNQLEDGFDVPLVNMADGSQGFLTQYDSSQKRESGAMGKEFEVFMGEYVRSRPFKVWIKPNGEVVEAKSLELLATRDEMGQKISQLPLSKSLKETLLKKIGEDEGAIISLNEMIQLMEELPKVLAGQLFPSWPSKEGKGELTVSLMIGGIGYFIGGEQKVVPMEWKKTPTGWKGSSAPTSDTKCDMEWDAVLGGLKSLKVERYVETEDQTPEGEAFTNKRKLVNTVERLPDIKKK